MEQIYLNWMQDEYGVFADQTISSVGLITTDGDCTAAAIVEADDHNVTLFVRGSDEVVGVLTGHNADWIDSASPQCFTRP